MRRRFPVVVLAQSKRRREKDQIASRTKPEKKDKKRESRQKFVKPLHPP
jgi:hypothetical protein